AKSAIQCKDDEVVVMRWAPRRARACIAVPAEVVDAFGDLGRLAREAGDVGGDSICQPVREGAPRCVYVHYLDCPLPGPRWRRTPLEAGEAVRAVAGELARDRSSGKVRA